MLLTAPPAGWFHGRSSGGGTRSAGSIGYRAWPGPRTAAAADPTPPVLRAGRAARLTRSAPEPFYNDATDELATATHAQRCNGGKLSGCGGLTPGEKKVFFEVSQHFLSSSAGTCFHGAAEKSTHTTKVANHNGEVSTPLGRHLCYRGWLP